MGGLDAGGDDDDAATSSSDPNNNALTSAMISLVSNNPEINAAVINM